MADVQNLYNADVLIIFGCRSILTAM